MDVSSVEFLFGVLVCLPLHEFLHWLPARIFHFKAKVHLAGAYTEVEPSPSGKLAFVIYSAPYLVCVPAGFLLLALGHFSGGILVAYNLLTLPLTSYRPGSDLRRIITAVRST